MHKRLNCYFLCLLVAQLGMAAPPSARELAKTTERSFFWSTYQAALNTTSNMFILRDAWKRCKLMLAAPEHSDEVVLREMRRMGESLRPSVDWVIQIDGAGKLLWASDQSKTLRLYKDTPTPFSILILNNSGKAVPFTMSTDDTFKLEWPVKPTVADAEFFDVGIGLLTASTVGQSQLNWQLALADAPATTVKIPVEVVALQPVPVRVRTHNDQPTTAAFAFRDKVSGQFLPPGAIRTHHDLPFQQQVYRADGETILLPPGEIEVTVSRGPESDIQHHNLHIDHNKEAALDVKLTRWIDLKEEGFYSGDTHIHPDGCRHFRDPRGMSPEAIFTHIVGEDLNVGHLLEYDSPDSLSAKYKYQSQFFDKSPHEISTPNHIIKYDIEISGDYPASHLGHPILLNLSAFVPPASSWNLPIMEWTKSQPKTIAGYAHPTFASYGFDKGFQFESVAARELPVDLILGAVDTIELLNQNRESELFLYYRLLNCGLRLTPVGGSDFPCISDRKVGCSRVYAQLPGELTWEKYIAAILAGKTFVSDGEAFVWLQSGDAEPGNNIALDQAGELKLNFRAAIRPNGLIRKARVELVKNGDVVAQKVVTTAGAWQNFSVTQTIDKSCWLAVRVMYLEGGEELGQEFSEVAGRNYFCSAHTAPIYVSVAGKPVRVAKRDPQWIIAWIDAVWKANHMNIEEHERPAAKKAFDDARRRYEKIAAESP